MFPSSQIASLESELVGTKREREELEKMLHASHEGAIAQIKHLKSVDSSTIRAITTPQKKEQVLPWFGLFADCYNDEGLTRAPRTLSAWTALWRHIHSCITAAEVAVGCRHVSYFALCQPASVSQNACLVFAAINASLVGIVRGKEAANVLIVWWVVSKTSIQQQTKRSFTRHYLTVDPLTLDKDLVSDNGLTIADSMTYNLVPYIDAAAALLFSAFWTTYQKTSFRVFFKAF